MIGVSTLNNYAYDYDGNRERMKWFKNNDKLIIVRHNDKHQGEIIGSFYDDVAAFEHIEKQMEYEGKIMTILTMNWMKFQENVYTRNNTYKYKIIKTHVIEIKKDQLTVRNVFGLK